MEANAKPYSQWNSQALKNELKFRYIELERKRDMVGNSEKIRKIEAELIERKIKTIINP